jgi:hypothetical protein
VQEAGLALGSRLQGELEAAAAHAKSHGIHLQLPATVLGRQGDCNVHLASSALANVACEGTEARVWVDDVV